MKREKPDFNFYINDLTIEKAKGKDGREEMILGGVASDDSVDTEQETLVPMGYDLSYFNKYGFINWNHKAKEDPTKIVGEPIQGEVRGNKFYIQGRLYSDSEMAKGIYSLAKTLQKSGSSRKLGWSIEGKALERDPYNQKRITRALITGVAITPTPVNSNTFVDIIKGQQKDDLVDYKFDYQQANGGKTCILDVVTDDGIRIQIEKDFTVKISKATTTQSIAPLMKESLDEDLKVLKACGSKIKKAVETGRLREESLVEFKEKTFQYLTGGRK